MSPKSRRRGSTRPKNYALIFAALGDRTRLFLLAQLCDGSPRSITQLTEGSRLTRQAITKHLQVMERAGLVHSVRQGRESRYEFDLGPIDGAKAYLDMVSLRWDEALVRLKAFVERE
jgi:DNA-binding transcriptional ArsR family regulator